MKLPQDALVLVLQHCSQGERLRSCALVSTAWNQAAAMATSAMSLPHKIEAWNPDTEVVPWLQQHGQHVTSLRYVNDPLSHNLQHDLPCANLKELYIEGGYVQLGPSKINAKPGILFTATGLTSLELTVEHSQHILFEGYEGLTALQRLRRLQQFGLAVGMHMVYGNHRTIHSSLLTGLTNLTSLSLRGQVPLDSLQFVSCLQKLQEITIVVGATLDQDGSSACDTRPFSRLHRLASLELNIPGAEGNVSAVLASSSGSPALAGCTALQVLRLSGFTFDPSVLQGLACLTALVFSGQEVQPLHQADVPKALAHISNMTGLAKLRIDSLLEELPEQHASAYAAVTASSQLQELLVEECSFTPGAWQCMFMPGRCISLGTLKLHCCDFAEFFTTEALQQLVRACPALHSLALHPANYSLDGVSLECLLQLSKLTGLSLQAITADLTCVGVVAKLTGLSNLVLNAEQLGDPSVLQLTALQQLTQLKLRLSHAAHLAHENRIMLEANNTVRHRDKAAAQDGCLALHTVDTQVGVAPCVPCWRAVLLSSGWSNSSTVHDNPSHAKPACRALWPVDQRQSTCRTAQRTTKGLTFLWWAVFCCARCVFAGPSRIAT